MCAFCKLLFYFILNLHKFEESLIEPFTERVAVEIIGPGVACS